MAAAWLSAAVGLVLSGRNPVPVPGICPQRAVGRTPLPSAIFTGLSDPPEPTLADFSVSGAPQIVRYAPGRGAGGAAEKPVLIYLPGIELSGYSAHRQYESLSEDYDVRYLAVPSDDRSSFEDIVELVRKAVEEAAMPSPAPRPAAARAAAGKPPAAAQKPKPAPTPSNLASSAVPKPAPASISTKPPSLPPMAAPDARALPAITAAAPQPVLPAAPRPHSPRRVFLCGESFGGVLALTVALGGGSKQSDGSYKQPPVGLAGLVLINPATGVAESWAARLPALLDALDRLPVCAQAGSDTQHV
jgi:hypothetical protein